jgi:hypothetical protein
MQGGYAYLGWFTTIAALAFLVIVVVKRLAVAFGLVALSSVVWGVLMLVPARVERTVQPFAFVLAAGALIAIARHFVRQRRMRAR